MAWRLFLVSLIALGALTGAAAPPEAGPRTVTLEQAISSATSNNLDLQSKLVALDIAAAREAQAKAAGLPSLSATAILSPTYAVTGDALSSANDLDRWGYWLQSTVTLIQPIFTWGRLSNYREAARHGIDVAQAGARKDTAQITYETKEIYYGAVLAEQLYEFLEGIKREIDDILVKAEEDQGKKHPSISKRDFFRLQIFAAEAEYRFQETLKLRTLARHALSLKLGFDPTEPTLPAETQLAAIDAPAPAESELLSKMLEARPEFAQLHNGIAAKRALLAAEHKTRFPMFFAGGLLSVADSNVRTTQASAFTYDPYNRTTAGIGLGLQWNLNFGVTSANEAMLRAEINELERKQEYAGMGFRLELKKAVADLVEARARLDAARGAFQYGRRWLVSETMGYSLGVVEIKNLVDAYLARAKTARDYWEAIYRVNLAWAALSKTTGTEVTPGL